MYYYQRQFGYGLLIFTIPRYALDMPLLFSCKPYDLQKSFRRVNGYFMPKLQGYLKSSMPECQINVLCLIVVEGTTVTESIGGNMVYLSCHCSNHQR